MPSVLTAPSARRRPLGRRARDRSRPRPGRVQRVADRPDARAPVTQAPVIEAAKVAPPAPVHPRRNSRQKPPPAAAVNDHRGGGRGCGRRDLRRLDDGRLGHRRHGRRVGRRPAAATEDEGGSGRERDDRDGSPAGGRGGEDRRHGAPSGVNRATLYGVTVCGPAGHAPGRTYAERVIRPLRDVPARPDLLLPALEAALSGAGPAVAPGSAGGTPRVGDDVAVVVRTSGSTGEPRGVLLSATALRASAGATHDRLAGPGHWLLALPTDHVAGLQVLVRSVLAGTAPTVLAAGPFRAAAFAAAVGAMPPAGPRYTSLVPTQLVRLLDDAAATDALALLRRRAARWRRGSRRTCSTRARAAGVAVVTTYGMTETCGGCVYDGRPLDGVVRPARRRRSHPAGRPGPRRRLPGPPRPRRRARSCRWTGSGTCARRTSGRGPTARSRCSAAPTTSWSAGASRSRPDGRGGRREPARRRRGVRRRRARRRVGAGRRRGRRRPARRRAAHAARRSAPPSPTASAPRTPRATSWSRTRSPCAARARSTVGPPRSSPSASSRGTPRDDCQRLGAGRTPADAAGCCRPRARRHRRGRPARRGPPRARARSRSVSRSPCRSGVNYANDYSDGIRGTDVDRVGPLRLTASGTASPGAVKAAAFAAFGARRPCSASSWSR